MAINIKFFLVLPVVLGISIRAAKAVGGEVKETKLTVYLHDIYAGPNATDVIVVGFPGKLWNYTQFGTFAVVDNLLTEGPKRTSLVVGRFRGMYYTAGLDGQNIGLTSSLVFTNRAYNGSTIQILATVNQLAFVAEYGVPSGTGKFRYANGYATFEIVAYDPSIIYTTYRINVSILHY